MAKKKRARRGGGGSSTMSARTTRTTRGPQTAPNGSAPPPLPPSASPSSSSASPRLLPPPEATLDQQVGILRLEAVHDPSAAWDVPALRTRLATEPEAKEAVVKMLTSLKANKSPARYASALAMFEDIARPEVRQVYVLLRFFKEATEVDLPLPFDA